MKKAVFMIPLMLCIAFGLEGFRMQAPPIDLSSPKATVRSFANAMAKKDIKGMTTCVQGAFYSADVEKLFASMPALPAFEIDNLIAEMDGETCRVAAVLRIGVPSSDRPDAPVSNLTTVDLFTLQKKDDTWLIASDPGLNQILSQANTGQLTQQQTAIRPLSMIATLLGMGKTIIPIMSSAHDQAVTAACLSNQKQIALGLIMYVQDYDEVFPRKKASYVDLVMPYIKNRQVFTCPLDPKEKISYVFNPNLQGVSLSKVASPANTVLLYEGKNMQLEFRHDGKAVVAFADGHVKSLTPEAAKSLFWYPAGKQPAPTKSTGKQKTPKKK